MTSITVTLPDERVEQLREMAKNYGITLEDLVRVGVEDLISRSDEPFREALRYVLTKNKELYKRLS